MPVVMLLLILMPLTMAGELCMLCQCLFLGRGRARRRLALLAGAVLLLLAVWLGGGALLETAGLDDGYQLRVISEDSPENPLRDLSYYEEKADDDEASLVCYLAPIRGQTPDFLAQLAPSQP